MSINNFYEYLPKNTPKHVVIMLHGVGSNGQDLISLAPYLSKFIPNAAFISPDAPFACDMVPPGYPNSYQWFSLQNRDPHVMLQGVKAVFPLVETFIEEQLKRFSLSHDQCALLGFSQGTMTALHVAPRLKAKISGVLGYSGALLWDTQANASAFFKPPMHLIHGGADDVVPVASRRYAQKTLESKGFTVTGQTTPNLAHSIDQEGIESGGAFLRSVFA